MCLIALPRLEHEQLLQVKSSECEARLLAAQSSHPGSPLCNFRSWQGVRRILDKVGLKRVEADPVLVPILKTFRASPDEAWNTILLFLFFGVVKSLLQYLQRLDSDREQLFSEVTL